MVITDEHSRKQVCEVTRLIRKFHVSDDEMVRKVEILCKRMGLNLDGVNFDNLPNVEKDQILVPVLYSNSLSHTFEKSLNNIELPDGCEISRKFKSNSLNIHNSSNIYPDSIHWGILNLTAHCGESALECWEHKIQNGHFAHTELLTFFSIYTDLVNYWIKNCSSAPSFNCSGFGPIHEGYASPKVICINFLDNKLVIGSGYAKTNSINIYNPTVKIIN